MNTLKTLTAAAALMLTAGGALAGHAHDLETCNQEVGATQDNRQFKIWSCLNRLSLARIGNGPTSTECVQNGLVDLAVKGTSDIDIMERCHVDTTPEEIEAHLRIIMTLRVGNGGHRIGRTPFKDAHCQPTYSGYQCEYNGVALEMTR
jgi:hypothetical protein